MEKEVFIQNRLSEFRILFNRVVKKGLLKEVWHIIKHFEDYKLHIEIEDNTLYDKRENNKLGNSIIYELGYLSYKGYECNENGHINWNPLEEIKECSDYMKIKEKQIKKEELRQKVLKGELSPNKVDFEVTKFPFMWMWMSEEGKEQLSKYDKSYKVFGISKVDNFEPEGFIPLSYQMFFKINEIIMITFANHLEPLGLNDDDFDDFILSLEDSYERVYDPIVDDIQYSYFYFQISASKSKVRELLIGADTEQWDHILKKRHFENGEYKSIDISFISQDKKGQYTSIFERERLETEAVEIYIKDYYANDMWYKRMSSSAKRKFISAEKYILKGGMEDFIDQHIVSLFLDSIKLQSYTIIYQDVDKLLQKQNLLRNSHKPKIEVRNIVVALKDIKKWLRLSNFRHRDISFLELGQLIYYPYMGYQEDPDSLISIKNLNSFSDSKSILEIKEIKEILEILNGKNIFFELNRIRNSFAHSKGNDPNINVNYTKELIINIHKILDIARL